VRFQPPRSRRAGRRAFVSVHVVVPGQWTVQRGHDLVERIEREPVEALGHATVFTHLEPIEDLASSADTELDRGASRTSIAGR
jgi:divalent metal cation (Fe/Co/Zn/Cd) transporter